jgi:hypothetical protein
MVRLNATYFFYRTYAMTTHRSTLTNGLQQAGVFLRVPRTPGTLAFPG